MTKLKYKITSNNLEIEINEIGLHEEILDADLVIHHDQPDEIDSLVQLKISASRPPFGLMVVGRPEYNNVSRNPCNAINERKYRSYEESNYLYFRTM